MSERTRDFSGIDISKRSKCIETFGLEISCNFNEN